MKDGGGLGKLSEILALVGNAATLIDKVQMTQNFVCGLKEFGHWHLGH